MKNKETRDKPKQLFIYKVFPFLISKDREFFIEQLSILLNSGMDVGSALESLKGEINSKYMQNVIEYMYTKINQGYPFWEILEQVDILPNQFISLVKVGEVSGRLADNLKIVATQYQRDKAMKSKILSASMYPAFVLGFTFVIGIGMAIYVLPKFTVSLSQLDVQIHFTTQLILSAGELFSSHGVELIISFFMILLAIVLLLFVLPATKHLGHNLILSFPGIKKLFLQTEISRFGFILGTLLNTGVPLTKSLKFLTRSTTLIPYKNLYRYILDSLYEGKTTSEAMLEYKGSERLIPLSFQNLIASSEKTGELPGILKRIGEIYEEKLQITSERLSIIIEPILLILIWIGVIVIALGIIMPIYNLVGNLSSF
jgi:type IV pilus assembly protein PilC